MFKRTYEFTKEDKINFAAMCGSMILWMVEKRDTAYMAEKLNMPLYQIEHNIDETLYELRKYVGFKRFLKALFIK